MTESKKTVTQKTTKEVSSPLREEETLFYFIQNRKRRGEDTTTIQEAWLLVKGGDLDKLYDKERLEHMVITNRQLLGYSQDGIEKAVNRICK